jgi:uncharacterized membrane protein YGL010W
MPFDLSAVNWPMVGLLSVFVLLSSFVGHLLSSRNLLVGAILAALLFAVFYLFWTYYPHGFTLPTIKVTP